MAYACGHLASLQLSPYEGMSDQQALAKIGLNTRVQDGITDPRYHNVFGTQTLHFWAKDTVLTNYAALLGRQSLLRRYANEHMLRKNSGKPAHHTVSGQEETLQQPALATATIDKVPQDLQFPESHVEVQPNVILLPNHISLFRGKAHLELQAAELIDDDGSVNIRALSSPAGGDFSWAFYAQYWTPERETAEQYRQYAARRCPSAESRVVHIQIPSSFLSTSQRKSLVLL